MTNGPALGVPATGAWARVPASLIHAGLLCRALGVAYALGSAVGCSPDELGVARARGLVVDHLAQGAWTAG